MKKLIKLFGIIAVVAIVALNIGQIGNHSEGNSSITSLISINKAFASWNEYGCPVYDTPVSTACNCPESCKDLRCIKVCCPLLIEGTCSKTCNE